MKKLVDEQDLLMFGQIPLLKIDGLNLVQSCATLRYLSRKHNMYGESEIQRVQIDILSDGIRDFLSKFTAVPFSEDYEATLKGVCGFKKAISSFLFVLYCIIK